jgi:hypothetical protein
MDFDSWFSFKLPIASMTRFSISGAETLATDPALALSPHRIAYET